MPIRQYETADSALAAYLLLQGFPEPDIRMDSGRYVFCFTDPDNDIQPHVRSYNTGTAIGNIPLFYRNYKRILNRIHHGV